MRRKKKELEVPKLVLPSIAKQFLVERPGTFSDLVLRDPDFRDDRGRLVPLPALPDNLTCVDDGIREYLYINAFTQTVDNIATDVVADRLAEFDKTQHVGKTFQQLTAERVSIQAGYSKDVLNQAYSAAAARRTDVSRHVIWAIVKLIQSDANKNLAGTDESLLVSVVHQAAASTLVLVNLYTAVHDSSIDVIEHLRTAVGCTWVSNPLDVFVYAFNENLKKFVQDP